MRTALGKERQWDEALWYVSANGSAILSLWCWGVWPPCVMETAWHSLCLGRGGSRNHAGNPLRNLRGGLSWRWSPNTVFYLGAAVPGKVHGHWGGKKLLWSLSAAKSAFSLSMWVCFFVCCWGSSQGRGVPAHGMSAFGQSPVCPLAMAGNSLWHFWTLLLAHEALCELKSCSLCRCHSGTWRSYLRFLVICVWAATWCGWDQGH